MSIWVHVNGSIRLNGMKCRENEIKQAFSGMTLVNDIQPKRPRKKRSLQYILWTTIAGLYQHTIQLFGDAQDSIERLGEWFHKTIEELGPVWIQSAILEVKAGTGEHFVFVFRQVGFNENEILWEVAKMNLNQLQN